MLEPLNADVKYIPSAHGSSSKKFDEEYKKAKEANKMYCKNYGKLLEKDPSNKEALAKTCEIIKGEARDKVTLRSIDMMDDWDFNPYDGDYGEIVIIVKVVGTYEEANAYWDRIGVAVDSLEDDYPDFVSNLYVIVRR